VVATLESGPERAALDLAKSRASMSGELKSPKRASNSRRRSRFAPKNCTSRISYRSTPGRSGSRLSIVHRAITPARENQKLAELEMQRSAEVLAMRTIRSPLSGIVVEVVLKPGEFSSQQSQGTDPQAGGSRSPARRSDTAGDDVRQDQNGQHAQVLPEQPVGGSYDAIVKVVDRVIDAASGTFGVRLQLPNPNYRIPAGIKCRVKFQ